MTTVEAIMATVEDSATANAAAVDRMTGAEPVLVDVAPAGDVVRGMEPNMILTSGPDLPWHEYGEGQLRSVVNGAIYEGLAADDADALRKLKAGTIEVRSCSELKCIGSVSGIYTASMPVLVVRNVAPGAAKDNLAYCNLYEGASRQRLNYGSYDGEVKRGLDLLRDEVGPLLASVLDEGGPISLKPIMARALRMGDELHSRNTAASILLTREVLSSLLAMRRLPDAALVRTIDYFTENDYFFLRFAMAAGKVMADAGHGVENSTVVTAMALSSREFGIKVSGLGDEWFRGPLPGAEQIRFFDNFGSDDVEWMGGESCIAETVGLGAFAQAAAFGLQEYQGGTPDVMVAHNEDMYRITVAENPNFLIPYFGHRGSPTGIDIERVVETGIVPWIDAGVAGRDGGQIGAGLLYAPIECFEAAQTELLKRRGGGHG